MNIVDFLKTFVLENTDTEEENFKPEATFDELGMDSLCFVEMQIGILKNFGVAVLPDMFVSGALKTLVDIESYVSGLVKIKSLENSTPALAR
jgi:acyl carrier protein